MSIESDIKSTVKLDEVTKTVINMMYTSNWIKEKSIGLFKNYDLSSEQYNVLRILRGQKGKPTSLGSIQERMLNKMSNTTRLVDKLIKKEFVTRHTCPTNRRKIEIYITKKGLKILKDLDVLVNTNNIEITRKLNRSEQQKLNELLDKLRSQ